MYFIDGAMYDVSEMTIVWCINVLIRSPAVIFSGACSIAHWSELFDVGIFVSGFCSSKVMIKSRSSRGSKESNKINCIVRVMWKYMNRIRCHCCERPNKNPSHIMPRDKKLKTKLNIRMIFLLNFTENRNSKEV